MNTHCRGRGQPGWEDLGDVVAYWWRCGGLLVEMWWLMGGDVVAYWWRCDVLSVELWLLRGMKCGGLLV